MTFEMPRREPCPFCDNVAGRVPASGVEMAALADDQLTLSFLNPRQIEPGALLVIPKRHAPTLLDLTADEATAVMLAVRRVPHALVEAVNPAGLNLSQNNGLVGYQSVPHFHMHVVPRYPDDGGIWGEKPMPDVTPLRERLTMAERIKRHL